MFEEIEKKFGHLDVLINNAGTAAASSFIDGKTEDWEKMLVVSLFYTYHFFTF